MQNQSAKINHNEKACIQDSKISRLHTGKSSKRTKECPPIDCNEKKHNVEKDIHLVQENHAFKNKLHKSHNSNSGLSSLFNRIMEFLKSDDALLVFVIILLIQDGIDDDILLGLIVYLLLADRFD